MQQAFRSVLCDGTSLMRVVPSAFNQPSPLMQQCQIGNHFVNVSYMMLFQKPMRVCWMGQQADNPFEPDMDAYANALPEEEFQLYYATAWENTSSRDEIPLGRFSDTSLDKVVNLRTKGSYLINHTRKIFIDMSAYISHNLVAGRCFDPLPLLTACGNGRGENEYPVTGEGYEMIGTWAFDLLQYTKQAPNHDYEEKIISFQQAQPGGKLRGKSFVVTGKVPGYLRGEFETLIQQEGGMVSNSVTKHTDYLVVAEKPGNTKLQAARRYGICQISVSQLNDMIRL